MSSPSLSSLPPNSHYEGTHSSSTPEPCQPSSTHPVTRTVAIIKTHALVHRFDIEPRIQEASFEIIKERQMEFDTETDPDTLYELFGEDATSFAEGPVWVYVLERPRAVEVWNTLMGDRDPDIARKDAPNSLRALYGISLQQNGLMGSSTTEMAELQIASLFMSSPPFPTSELPDERYGSINSVSSSVLSELKKATSDEGYAASNVTNPSTVGGSNGNRNSNVKSGFRARPIPSTNTNPDIVPRMTRSASLRAGGVVDKTSGGPRAPLTKQQLAKTFANVPGHKRAETIAVASTAAPTIAPRMTKAASLRLGMKPEAPRKALSSEEAIKATFEGVPGHKRRESIAVASSKAPTLAPRLNKSAALRAKKEQAPPSSFMFRTASEPKLPGLSRSRSQSSTSLSRPSLAPPPPRPASQTAQVHTSRNEVPRSSIATNPKLSLASKSAPKSSQQGLQAKATENGTITPGPKLRPRQSIAPPAPSIAPRTNRSAVLRAAKQERENQVAAGIAARKNPRASLAPSSFKST